jgi:PP-loop superfamily ATP-utilizing enzyme
VGTISKLIKFSSKKEENKDSKCFLCKQKVTEEVTNKMTENFPVEKQKEKYD